MTEKIDPFEEIVSSHINGNGSQMVRQIDELGWYEFTLELEMSELLSTKEKLELLCKAIRLRKL